MLVFVRAVGLLVNVFGAPDTVLDVVGAASGSAGVKLFEETLGEMVRLLLVLVAGLVGGTLGT